MMIKHRLCRETAAEILYGMRCRNTKAIILRIFIAQPQHAAPESIGPVVIVIELVSSIHADMRESAPESVYILTYLLYRIFNRIAPHKFLAPFGLFVSYVS
ncbi:hypothetical protein D3C81_2032550 [compost metagenome]